MPRMCSIGRNLDTSVGASAPASTLLGAASIGGASTAGGPRRVMGGTLLTGGPGGSTGGPGGPTETAPRTKPRKLQDPLE